MHILRKTFFSKEQQKNFKFFLRRNIECTPSSSFNPNWLLNPIPSTRKGVGCSHTSHALSLNSYNDG